MPCPLLQQASSTRPLWQTFSSADERTFCWCRVEVGSDGRLPQPPSGLLKHAVYGRPLRVGDREWRNRAPPRNLWQRRRRAAMTEAADHIGATAVSVGSLEQLAAGAVTWANGPMPRCGQLSRGVRGRCASWRAGPGLPATLPGGVAEARRSRVARSAIARDAVGALDLGEAAPQAAQSPRTPPTETAEEPKIGYAIAAEH